MIVTTSKNEVFGVVLSVHVINVVLNTFTSQRSIIYRKLLWPDSSTGEAVNHNLHHWNSNSATP